MRIRRADLPEQNSQAVYQRMQTERQREAAEFRAQGAQRAQEIRSRADREVTVLVAEATSKSEQIRGEGDATRNQIFADAFNKDPDFFAFYRSMQAYEAGLKPNDTRLLLKPDTNFFRYFNDPSGKPSRGAGRRRPRRQSSCAHAGDDGFPGRARAGLRDRGPGVCRLSRRRPSGRWRASWKRRRRRLRAIGIGSAVIGLILVWLVRS